MTIAGKGLLWFAVAILSTALICLSASAQTPRRVALVIGNANYQHAGRLANPLSDTRLVAGALRQAGFQTIDAHADLGHQAFGRALRDFRSKASGANVALVYFAGHGIEGNGKNWLIPTDAKLNSEYDLVYEAINLDQVTEALAGARMRVVILDACRNNPLGRSWTRGSRVVGQGLAPIEVDDVLVIYAAAPGQTASDGVGASNSPFAAALARRLPEPGLPLQLLGGMVRDDVIRATGDRQRPFVSASITGTPYYLVPGAGASAAQSAPPPGPSPEAVELSVWQGALAAYTVPAFESYLRQYPAGRFRDLAQQNIARLRATTATAPSSLPAPASSAAHFPASLSGRWILSRAVRVRAGACPAVLDVAANLQQFSYTETDAEGRSSRRAWRITAVGNNRLSMSSTSFSTGGLADALLNSNRRAKVVADDEASVVFSRETLTLYVPDRSCAFVRQ